MEVLEIKVTSRVQPMSNPKALGPPNLTSPEGGSPIWASKYMGCKDSLVLCRLIAATPPGRLQGHSWGQPEGSEV